MIGNQFMLSFFAAGMKGGEMSEMSVTPERLNVHGRPPGEQRWDFRLLRRGRIWMGGWPGDGGGGGVLN